MFNFCYPRPVVDGRAVAVQVVQQKEAARSRSLVLVVESPVQLPASGIKTDMQEKNKEKPAGSSI